MTTIPPALAQQEQFTDTARTRPALAPLRPLWNAVFIPFIATRAVLFLLGWLANFFPFWPQYPPQWALARGWQFSPYHLLDMWGRWDSGWYLDIVRHGYIIPPDYMQQQSNVAFFPLYPMLIRFLLWPIPASWQTDGVLLLAGFVVSNVCLLAALILIYFFVQEMTQDSGVVQRTILYLLLFPTAFYLSCVYTESTFLLLSVAALYAAQRRQWLWAALAAALLSITRAQGILMGPILLWAYMSAAGWRLRNVRADVLWLLLTPLPLLLHLAWLWQRTGDWLTAFHAHHAFYRGFGWPWTSLLTPAYPNQFLTPLEQGFIVLFLVLALVACWRLPTAAYGLWVLAVIMPALFTGTTNSSLRFLLTAMPAFIVLGLWGKNTFLDRLLQTLFFAIQIVLMVAWCLFYFVA
jgi:hypothetical protein